jgi:ABC-type lipoprotein export system ATPase subunit
MTNSEYMLELTNVHKIYAPGSAAEVHALRGVDLTVKHGEMIAIMGASGSGKSTLLNMIGGLDRKTEGSIILDGIDMDILSDKMMTTFRRDKIGFIFQLFNLFPFLTALQNVMLPLLLQQQDLAIARQRASRLLRELGLGGRLDHKPGELSGGQQQRIAIARSLITQPKLILGDEPTGDLDTTTSSDILSIFRRLNTENKQTMVLVTHSAKIGELCDRIVRIHDGKIIEEEQ